MLHGDDRRNQQRIAGRSAGAAAAAATNAPKGPKAIEPIKLTKESKSPTEAYQINATVKDKGGRPILGVPYKIEDPDGKIIRGSTPWMARSPTAGIPRRARSSSRCWPLAR
jgi:hypothetical protein